MSKTYISLLQGHNIIRRAVARHLFTSPFLLVALFTARRSSLKVKGGASLERYGVFKKFANGSRLRIGPADDLDEVKVLMMASASKTGLEHFVHDFVLERIVATSRESSGAADGSPE